VRESLKLAINESYIDMNAKLELKENDEIAVIPPINGG
jgi:molybdopterin converting factor small subunit